MNITMESNKKIVNRKQQDGRQQQKNNNESERIVNDKVQILTGTMSDSINYIQKQRYFDNNLAKIAYLSHLINIQDFFHSQLAYSLQATIFNKDCQPKPITIDNLCRPSLQKLSFKSSLPSIKESRISQKSLSQSKITSTLIRYKSQSLKLKLEPIQQMKVFSDFRQRKLEQQNERIKKQQQTQQQQKRLAKLQSFNIDVSFDYNGERMFKRNNIQNNLVQKLLNLKLKKQTVTKRNEGPPQASNIQATTKSKYLKKSNTKEGKSEFTQFLDCQSLTDSIEINKGIRYSHNSLVFQQKKPKIQPYELKNSLGKRKISKSEFSKVSEFVDKKREAKLKKFKTEQMSENEFQSKRAYSETNLNSSQWKRREMINVINPELRQSMLIRLADYQSFLVIEKEFPTEKYQNGTQKDNLEDSMSIASFTKNDQTKSRITEAVSSIPKLPEIRQKILPQTNEEDLVITKLNSRLRSKLQI